MQEIVMMMNGDMFNMMFGRRYNNVYKITYKPSCTDNGMYYKEGFVG